MSEAKLLRVLADKIDDLDAVKLFPADITDPDVLTVAWSAGNDNEGYQALSEAIGALVKQHWGALRSQVVKQREADVQTARAEWTGHAKGAGDALSPAAAESGLRKVAG